MFFHKVLSSYNILLKLGNFSNRLSVSFSHLLEIRWEVSVFKSQMSLSPQISSQYINTLSGSNFTGVYNPVVFFFFFMTIVPVNMKVTC